MTRRMETRSVEVAICDFCGSEIRDESERLVRCVLCGREACFGGSSRGGHFAYSLTVHRYTQRDDIDGKICHECAAEPSVPLAKALWDFLQKAK